MPDFVPLASREPESTADGANATDGEKASASFTWSEIEGDSDAQDNSGSWGVLAAFEHSLYLIGVLLH